MALGDLENIFGDSQDDEQKKTKTPSNSSQSRTVTADPLENIFAKTPAPTQKQVQVETAAKPQEPQGFVDKTLNVVGNIAKGIGDWFNNQQKKNDEASFKMGQLLYGGGTIKVDEKTGKKSLSSPQLDAYNAATTPEEKAKVITDYQQSAPLMQFLNSDTGKKITGTVASATSNVPLKVIAGIKALGDDTYDEAYSALVAKSKDPNNSRFEKIMYGLQDSGVQSAIGALLAVGTSVLTRNPSAGRAVSLAYFAPISAESQRSEENGGKVTSLGNIAIDTVGDTILSGVAEAALKSVAKEGGEATLKALLKSSAKGFVTEGGTEVSQSFLKYANDYTNAKTDAEKQKVVDALTKYVKEGGMTDEFLIGGLSGAAITGAAAGIGKVTGTKTDPSLIPPDKGGGGDEGGGAPPPKGTLTGTLNADFSKVRDEANTLAAEVRNDPSNDQLAQRLTIVQGQLDDYHNAVKDRPVYIADDTQDAPLATIETVQYPDGKFAYRFSADTQTNSVQSPFNTTQTYASKEEAVREGKKQILAWVKSQLPQAEGAEVAKLKEIQQELKKPTKVTAVKAQTTQETEAKKPLNKEEKAPARVVVKSNIQVNPNVEKTGKGVYRVTQYTQKGEAQGKAEAKFTRSKKTGKLYFEVSKDGERIERTSLEAAKKKYQTTDRAEMVERAVNGKYNKETKKWDMRQSNAPVIRNTTQNQVEKKPVKTKGEVKHSKAFLRVQERLGEFADSDVNYNRLNLAEDTAKALEFIEKYPKEAKKIALGLQGAPEGVTETAISIALAEQAADNKDFALQAQLERSRSLRQTRRGQEIVSERGRFNENSPHFFMQQVLAARLEKAGKVSFKFLTRNKEGRAQTAEARIKQGTENVKQTVKKKLSAADLAQNVIDSITC